MLRAASTVAVIALASVVTATSADGSWRADALGTGAAEAAVMPVIDGPDVAVEGARVTVSWPEQEVEVRYSVVRSGDTTSSICHRVASESCVDDPVPAGVWRYTVVAHYEAWTGEAGRPSEPVVIE